MDWLYCSGLREYQGVYGDCNKKLLKFDIEHGIIEIKCHRCGTINEVSINDIEGVNPIVDLSWSDKNE